MVNRHVHPDVFVLPFLSCDLWVYCLGKRNAFPLAGMGGRGSGVTMPARCRVLIQPA